MADTNENGKLPIIPMKEERRPLLKDINHFLTCFLCDGYFFNATTIVECAHTYCRACIVKFLKTEKYCPACGAQGHRTKSNPSLRYDAIIQKLVYKTVPGLYQKELACRNSHLKEAEISAEDTPKGDDRLDEDYYFSPDEPISISLEYTDNKLNGYHNDATTTSDKIDNLGKEAMKHKRYLQCPAKLTIRHIYKFIKLKYNLQRTQEVEVLYDKNKLPGSFTLMDIAYTFSWKRDTPMRLCYRILESITIQVPQTVTEEMSNESVPVKNNFVTNSSSPNNISNAVQSTNDIRFEDTTTKSENLPTKVNLKRKLEEDSEITSNTKESLADNTKEPPSKDETPKDEPELPGHGLLVKVPRISNTTFKDIMDFKKDGHEDKPKPTATVSPCTTELPAKPATTANADDFNDDYMKYEQDIEEVEDDDDDDDDDRLRISQLSEEDTRDDKREDNADQNIAIETSDLETAKEERKEPKLNGDASKKSAKYKRKNKKSKHSHHHKHRHHERKSKAPQATILHSADTDIMKLKLKINTVKPDVKYHKQKRKRKKSSECYFSSSFSSSSSVSSASGMSPDTHSTSRIDEDSLHSHTSELSAESMDTSSSKDETTTKPTAPAPAEPVDKYQSPSSKENLLQIRAFRPRNVAVVKPEENHKLEKPAEKSSKNDNNNNDNTTIIETNKKPKPAPVVLRPPSSITVSKITAAEKQKMEQEKLLMMNGNNDDKPSLEIMLVNGPPSSTKSFVSPAVSSTTDVITKPKTPPRLHRPPPAVIPITQFQKMKSNEQPTNIPKSLTITPQIQRSKSINETSKKAKDAVSIQAAIKRSVSMSLPGNPRHNNDFNGALDLSSGAGAGPGPAIKMPKYPDTVNIPHSHAMLAKKLLMNGVRTMHNGGISNYSPVSTYSSLADANALHKHIAANRSLLNGSPKHKTYVSSPHSSPKLAQSRSNNAKSNKPGILPELNEIKIGPVSSSNESVPPKPGPNQTVRQIPNPSMMLQRHQATVNYINSTIGTDYVPIKYPHSTSNMRHRVAPNACSFSTLKKVADTCPPMMPIKAYLDNMSSAMATK